VGDRWREEAGSRESGREPAGGGESERGYRGERSHLDAGVGACEELGSGKHASGDGGDESDTGVQERLVGIARAPARPAGGAAPLVEAEPEGEQHRRIAADDEHFGIHARPASAQEAGGGGFVGGVVSDLGEELEVGIGEGGVGMAAVADALDGHPEQRRGTPDDEEDVAR
jgi:hypothetical protein